MSQEIRLDKIYIVDIAETGQGIGKHEGLVIFVDGAVPGDVVDVRIYKKKKNLAHASILAIQMPSIHRAEPFCAHFGTCGGCKWQHLHYATQLELKQKSVVDTLERIAGVDFSSKNIHVHPIIASDQNRYYRNKLEYTFSNRAWLAHFDKNTDVIFPQALGFHVQKQFDKILHIEECFLQADPSNDIRNSVYNFCAQHNYAFYNYRTHEGELRNLIIRTTSTGELMVAVIFAHINHDRIQKLMEFLKQRFAQITSLLYVINTKKNDTIFDQNAHLYAGRDFILESMPNLDEDKPPLQFKIGLKSFYQTNSTQAYALYKAAAEFANLKGNEIVYDLYTGAGTIANFIAAKAKKVAGIEYVPSAIEDAIYNSKLNHIANTHFFAGDMKDALNQDFIQAHGSPDVIIVDPPRAGMHPDVVKRLLEMEAKKIIYVSCNVSTQARDIEILAKKYRIRDVQAVDMFPHTQHVENIVSLHL